MDQPTWTHWLWNPYMYDGKAMVVEREAIESIPPFPELPHDDIGAVMELVRTTPVCSVTELVVTVQNDEYGASASKESYLGQADMYRYSEDLYDTIPDDMHVFDDLKAVGRAKRYEYLARAELADSAWSADATRYLLKSARTGPRGVGASYHEVVLSLFGRWGFSAYRRFVRDP